MKDLDKASVLNVEPESSAAPSVARFTRAPWLAVAEKLHAGVHISGRIPCVTANEMIVAAVHRVTYVGGKCETAEANARLIAAAPDLLDALIATRGLLRSFITREDDFARTIMELGDAALAKAAPPKGDRSESTTSNTESSP